MNNDNFFEIALATRDDVNLILQAMAYLKREFPSRFFVPSTKEELQYVLEEEGGFILLAKVDNQLAGGIIIMYPNSQIHYLSSHAMNDCAIVDSVFLDPRFRKRGIASGLMKAALARLENKPYVYASVALDNKHSQNLFKRHGFRIYEQKRLYENYERYVLLLERGSDAL